MSLEIKPTQFADSIALIVDRAQGSPVVLSSAWLVAENKIITTGDSVMAYGKHLSALEIFFPSVGKRCSVSRIFIHPLFKKRSTILTAEQSTQDADLFSTVKKHNCAVLYLHDTIDPLSDAQRKELNQSLDRNWASSPEGLSGNLHEIELSLVLQTLTNAKKQGELVIVGARRHPLAQIYFDQGNIVSARFGHLIGQVALNQIVARKLQAAFFFRPGKPPGWIGQASINKPTDILLLESFRRLDELEGLRSALGGPDLVLMRNGDESLLEKLPPDARDIARAVWSTADGLTPASRLWHLLNLDDYEIFQALTMLSASQLVVRSNESGIDSSSLPKGNNAKIVAQPAASTRGFLAAAPNLPLAAFDSFNSTIVDGASGKCATKSGNLLGAIDAYDSWHLIHNLLLLPESVGTPIFKDGAVVAMHTGALSSSPEIALVTFQQCLWIDSILKCLSAAGEGETVKRLSQAFEKPTARATSSQTSGTRPTGCVEVAAINCPACGSSSFKSARQCRSCGLQLIPSPPVQKRRHRVGLIATVFVSVAALLVLCFTYMSFPKLNFAQGPAICLPSKPWVSLAVKKANLKTATWETQPARAAFKNGDVIYLHIDVNRPCYIYLLHQTNKKAPELIFPAKGQPPVEHPAGTSLTFPEEIERQSGQKRYLVGMNFEGSAGDETIVCLASQTPLTFLRSNQEISTAFERASEAYSWESFPNGFELSGKSLNSRGQSGVENLSRPRELVFVDRLVAAHGM